MAHRARRMFFDILALGVAMLAGVIVPAGAQSALPPAVDAFVASANALAKSAGERVDLGRARLTMIRRELTNVLLAARAGIPLRLALDNEILLCDARANHVAVALRRNYLQAVAGKVEEAGKPARIDNLQSAVKSLFASQSVDLSAGIPSAEELKAAEKRMRDRCSLDVKSFDSAFYGKSLDQPADEAHGMQQAPDRVFPSRLRPAFQTCRTNDRSDVKPVQGSTGGLNRTDAIDIDPAGG